MTCACLLIGMADLIAHDILRLYLYHPGLLPALVADEHLGLVLAELVFVPGLLSTLATVSAQRRPWVSLLLASVIVGTEATFAKLGFLEYHGWQLWFSAISFPLYAVVVAKWTTLLERHGYTGVLRVIMLVASATQLLEPWANISTAILGTWAIRPHLLSASLPDQIVGMYFLYQIPAVLLLTLVIVGGWARTGWGYPFIGLAFASWLLLLERLGLVHHAPHWSLAGEAVLLMLLTWVLAHLDTLLNRAGTPHGPTSGDALRQNS